MDKTGFRVGCGKGHWVVTLDPDKSLLLTDSDNREYLTSVETISGGGLSILPMLILSGIVILEKWAKENDLDGNIPLATSPTGYSNDVLAMRWLVHFERNSHKTQVGTWRLLIMDEYGSYLTYEFYDYAQKHCIELFRLPPHSTHLTQLLDVGCFQPYKHYYSETINNAMKAGAADYGKLEFLASLQTIRSPTFKKSIIRSAVKNTGLISYNLEIVLRKIRALKPAPRAVTPPPSLIPDMQVRAVCDTTSRHSDEIKGLAETLLRTMKQNEWLVNRKLRPYLEQFIRGSVTNAINRIIAERDLEIIHQEAIARAACKKLTGKIAQKGKVILVRDVPARIAKRNATEVEKARKALERAEAAEARKEKAWLATQKNLQKQLHKELKAFVKARPALAILLT